MPNREPDKVVVDAADAVTSSRDVPWERYARLVTPAGRGRSRTCARSRGRSLRVVLYEMVAGRHPFAGTGPDEVTDRILLRRIAGSDRPRAGSATPPAALEFAASLLKARRASRPATAGALAVAGRRLPAE